MQAPLLHWANPDTLRYSVGPTTVLRMEAEGIEINIEILDSDFLNFSDFLERARGLLARAYAVRERLEVEEPEPEPLTNSDDSQISVSQDE